MRLAREGLLTVAVSAALCVGAWMIAPWAVVLPGAVLALALWFYRDPERYPDAGASEDDWLSPADGKVVEIIPGAIDEYAGRTTKIGIFMNGTDVHVNRFPAAGTIEDVRYVPGKKWFAIAPKASEINERMYVGISTSRGRTTLVQIAGILARRISFRKKIGDTLARGERYGMIKLGSKVDIYLPNGMSPAVAVGDIVRAGRTVVAVPDR